MRLNENDTVRELLELFNMHEIKYQDIMDLFGVSRDLIKSRLKAIGIKYDNQKKTFIGKVTEDDLNIELAELFRKNKGKNLPKVSDNASNKIAIVSKAKANKMNLKASEKLANEKLDAIDMLLIQNDSNRNRIYRGFYWDTDIIHIIDDVKHGNKSDLMNEIVRSVLKEKGLL